MNKKALIKAVLERCRAGGCICDPTIKVAAKHGSFTGLEVAHDSWCGHKRDDEASWQAFLHELRSREGKQ